MRKQPPNKADSADAKSCPAGWQRWAINAARLLNAQKIRDLLKALRDAGFTEIPGAGKGSHRKLVHPDYPGAVTVSGNLGAGAKWYQEKQIAPAIDAVQK